MESKRTINSGLSVRDGEKKENDEHSRRYQNFRKFSPLRTSVEIESSKLRLCSERKETELEGGGIATRVLLAAHTLGHAYIRVERTRIFAISRCMYTYISVYTALRMVYISIYIYIFFLDI